MRVMKERDKAFHAQAKLVSYFPQIHLLLLVVYSLQLEEIFMYLLLGFKKRPPVKSKLLRRSSICWSTKGGIIATFSRQTRLLSIARWRRFTAYPLRPPATGLHTRSQSRRNG